ncbi:hypothetical protein NDU88_002649 [Pleurodeles waltl]|uniref:Uncharacterized protein n=1 Tax=Pleurodeles waltl TaxID=8319 RepID=A0AAV7WP64_PLEWA|nr:hypothetical protein NDU88_002649 [Pleurodeles waltl]
MLDSQLSYSFTWVPKVPCMPRSAIIGLCVTRSDIQGTNPQKQSCATAHIKEASSSFQSQSLGLMVATGAQCLTVPPDSIGIRHRALVRSRVSAPGITSCAAWYSPRTSLLLSAELIASASVSVGDHEAVLKRVIYRFDPRVVLSLIQEKARKERDR